jgi:hypothetical protein
MRRIHLFLAISTSLLVFSCRGPEEEFLAKFFAAVRIGDHVTLAGMSVVGFSGPVDSWEVLEIRPEKREPFRLAELRRRAVEADDEVEEQFVEFSEFRKRNLEEFEMIRDRLDEQPEYRFRGKWGEIQAEWERFRDRHEDLYLRRLNIRQEIDRETILAKMSLMSSEEIDRLKGEIVIKDVLLTVKTSEMGETTYLFTMRRYDLVNRETEFQPPSRWIITSIEEI